MELPFKYIVLCIIRTLKERNMPLVIEKVKLVDYLREIMNKAYFTIEEKKEIGENLDFKYEISSLLSKYYQYFDDEGDKIVFDNDYIDELGNLIVDEIDEYDIMIVQDVDFVIDSDTTFLDILGVPIKKELYNYLLDIEKEIEDCYNEMFGLDCYVGMAEVDLKPLIDKMKKLNMKKTIMLLNTKNLLSNIEQHDLMNYAHNMNEKVNELEDVEFLCDDLKFGPEDIVLDVFLRSIFTGSDSYISNLEESLIINHCGIIKNDKCSRIKFYLTFLDLLEKEIEESNEFLQEELIKVKYRVMNVMDSVYGMTLFVNKDVSYNEIFKEDYDFIERGAYYFAVELLMYDDEKYRNKESDMENIITYLNNILKKIFIETYYGLTKDEELIKLIKNNENYKTNGISASFLKDIVNKPKTKTKEI